MLTHRVGLMGNPSDGFNGKTIAMTISNFWAEVTLMESQTLVMHVFRPEQFIFCMLCKTVTLHLSRCWSLIHSMILQSLEVYRICSASAGKKGIFTGSRTEQRRQRGSGFLTMFSLPPPADTWEVCGYCRPLVRSSISSAPNKGETGNVCLFWFNLLTFVKLKKTCSTRLSQ